MKWLQPAADGPRRRDSLAGRLTRTLIVWVGGVWMLCVLGVVWYVDREINHNFDNELVEVSHRMFDLAVQELHVLQREQGPGGGTLIAPPQLFSDSAVMYQVVDLHERMLLRSAEAPREPFDVPRAPGFANTGQWRIYTVRHPTLDLFLQVADPLADRRRALNRTLFGLIIPLGAVLPLLALVLRNVARTELRVLQRLAEEIEKRSGADLRPIGLPADLPRELRTVGDHVNRLLERLSQALDVERALAANAAHELRTPLAAARLRLETAFEHELRREDVQAALDALQVLSHRTEKLLQLSRAESGASLARVRIDLVQLAGTVAQEFWQQAHANAQLTLKVPDTEAPVALGDVDALAIALRNLVENALRYSGSRVVIEVMAPCTLAVRDLGPGVGAEQLSTLRQRHVRHANDHAGYGLGLSIVATIVEKHGARLELSSPPPGAASGFEARIVLAAA
jgi:two-component system OmpR family sensor kinase